MTGYGPPVPISMTSLGPPTLISMTSLGPPIKVVVVVEVVFVQNIFEPTFF